MAVTVKFQRRNRLRRKLLKLAPAAEKRLVEATAKSAAELEASAKGFAPVRTGALRNSIRTELVNKGTGARVGSDLFYSLFVEVGTVNAPRQPFLFPSYRLLRRRIKGRYSRAINKSAKEVART